MYDRITIINMDSDNFACEMRNRAAPFQKGILYTSGI